MVTDLNVQSTTGTLAVGALSLAACAAAVQSFVDMKPFFVELGTSAVWQIFIAAPILVLTYLLGLVTARLAAWVFEVILRDRHADPIADLVLIGRRGTELVVSEYKRAVGEREFLQGSSLALIFLATALALKVARATPDIGGHLPSGRFLFGVVAALLISFVPLLAAMIRERARFEVALARKLATEDVVAAATASSPERALEPQASASARAADAASKLAR